jgi:hypothetical protein
MLLMGRNSKSRSSGTGDFWEVPGHRLYFKDDMCPHRYSGTGWALKHRSNSSPRDVKETGLFENGWRRDALRGLMEFRVPFTSDTNIHIARAHRRAVLRAMHPI